MSTREVREMVASAIRDAAGLPVGFQVQAPVLREDVALRVAAAVEAASGERERFPERFA